MIKRINISLMLRLLLVLSLGILILPFTPGMPGTNLDPSWVIGLLQAQTQGAQVGQDIIFTFGPYSFLYTKAYHPTLIHLMWLSASFLALAYAVLCWQTLKNTHPFWIGLMVVLFGFLLQAQDAVLFIYPLLFGVWLWQCVSQAPHTQNHLRFNLLFSFFSSVLGLLLLIKGNLTFLVLGIFILCVCFLLYKRRYLSSALLCLTSIVSCIGFWRIAQQDLIYLTTYFVNLFEVSQGYTEAMAIRHEIHDALLFPAACTGLLIYLGYKTKNDRATQLFLFLLFAYFFFVNFKTGLVRNDLHSITAGNCLYFASILIFSLTSASPTQLIESVKQSRYLKLMCAVLALSLLSIQLRYVAASVILPQVNYQIVLFKLRQVFTPFITNTALEDQYQQRLTIIDKDNPLPTLGGTSDIYEHQQAFLIASHKTWNPRPIFQSYSAYTPKLARLNQAHLLSEHAPDHLFFNVEPIDNRYPTLNDGLSWPVLLQQYQPSIIQTKDFLILDRASSAKPFAAPATIHEHSAQLNEQIAVPNINKPVFVELLIEPSFFGKIATTLYKTSDLLIEVALDNGEIKQHRIIANMTKTGFVISPYVASRDDFAKLYLSTNDLHRVRSFKVRPYNGAWLWQRNYQVVFKQISN
jgi:hypothetical protein